MLSSLISSANHLIKKYHMVGVFLLALVVRLLFVGLLRDQPLRWDEPYYDLLASRILEGHGFSFPLDAYHTGVAHQPTSFQEPVYPVCVALVYWVFGPGNRIAVYISQAFLGALTVLVMLQIGKRVFGLCTGLIAAALATFYPPLLFFGRLLMTDTLFISLLMSIILFTLSSVKHSANWRDVVVGLLIGLGALTRTEMLPVLAIVILYHVLSRFGEEISALVARSIIIVGTAVLTIAPWTIRNCDLHQSFIPISTKLGYNLYYYNYPSDDYRFNERTVPFPDLSGLSEPERERVLRSEGIAFIRSSPMAFVKRALLKLIDFWRPWPSEGSSALAERIVALLSFVPISAMGLVGLYLAGRAQEVGLRHYAFLSVALLGLWLAKAMVFTGGFKARIAVEPTLVVFASCTVACLIRALRNRGWVGLTCELDGRCGVCSSVGAGASGDAGTAGK